MAVSHHDCVFCRIAAGELHARQVLETPRCVAFLDAAPLAPGHTLVVPREHAVQLHELSDDVVAELAVSVRSLGRAIAEAVGAAGYNVLQNNGAVAGQVVQHVHFHLIPRREDDGLGYRWNPIAGEDKRDDELAGRIRRALAQP